MRLVQLDSSICFVNITYFLDAIIILIRPRGPHYVLLKIDGQTPTMWPIGGYSQVTTGIGVHTNDVGNLGGAVLLRLFFKRGPL